MDLMLIAGIVAVGLIIFAVVMVMLNRAWGDFPGRISGLPPAMPPAQPTSSSSSLFSAPSLADAPPAIELPAGAPAGGLVAVSHPMVRQAVMTALERGGSPYALYFIKDGEAVYLVPGRIADPQQRALVTRMFTSLNDGGGGSLPLGDIVRVMQELGKK
jgi:hypothetical protein